MRPQQVSSRGLLPRLSIGTLQLSIRCSSIHFLPRRSFPVSTVEVRFVSGPLAARDCSCAMAGDSAAITSEAVTPNTCLREEGRMKVSLVGGRSRRLAQEIAENTPFLAADIKPSCLISCNHACLVWLCCMRPKGTIRRAVGAAHGHRPYARRLP